MSFAICRSLFVNLEISPIVLELLLYPVQQCCIHWSSGLLIHVVGLEIQDHACSLTSFVIPFYLYNVQIFIDSSESGYILSSPVPTRSQAGACYLSCITPFVTDQSVQALTEVSASPFTGCLGEAQLEVALLLTPVSSLKTIKNSPNIYHIEFIRNHTCNCLLTKSISISIGDKPVIALILSSSWHQ